MAFLLFVRHSGRIQACRPLFNLTHNLTQSFATRSFHAKTSSKTSSFEEESGVEFNQNYRFFESKKMGELARALFVLKFSSYEFLVKNSLPVSICCIPIERFPFNDANTISAISATSFLHHIDSTRLYFTRTLILYVSF